MTPARILRIAITLALAAAAAFIGLRLWHHYMDNPWTRDGRVHADVVEIAPDVSGLITASDLHDNQRVSRGDVLLHIDAARYRDALAQARADLAVATVTLAQRRRELKRRIAVSGSVVSKEDLEIARAHLRAAQADVDAAEARVQTAQLNLARTTVRAPVDGYITHLQVFTGDYAQAGHPLLALIDAHSFRVDGYFEETKLQAIHVGDAVSMRLLGSGARLTGHVESVAHGIADADDRAGAGLLAQVNPTFSWVRLAQRVPVRIALDPPPDGTVLAAGMTCTVVVHPHHDPGQR